MSSSYPQSFQFPKTSYTRYLPRRKRNPDNRVSVSYKDPYLLVLASSA
jgi:hypothetical protein